MSASNHAARQLVPVIARTGEPAATDPTLGAIERQRPRREVMGPFDFASLDKPTVNRRATPADPGQLATALQRSADDHATALRALRADGFSEVDAARGAIVVINALARAGRLA